MMWILATVSFCSCKLLQSRATTLSQLAVTWITALPPLAATQVAALLRVLATALWVATFAVTRACNAALPSAIVAKLKGALRPYDLQPHITNFPSSTDFCLSKDVRWTFVRPRTSIRFPFDICRTFVWLPSYVLLSYVLPSCSYVLTSNVLRFTVLHLPLCHPTFSYDVRLIFVQPSFDLHSTSIYLRLKSICRRSFLTTHHIFQTICYVKTL